MEKLYKDKKSGIIKKESEIFNELKGLSYALKFFNDRYFVNGKFNEYLKHYYISL